MQRNFRRKIQLVLALIVLSLNLQAQDYSPRQRDEVRRNLIENEKTRYINQYRSAGRIQQSARSRYDVTFYNLNLDLDPAASMLRGEVTIEGACLSSGLNQLEIDLSADMEIDSIYQGLNVLDFTRQQDLVTITPARVLGVGDRFSITICYHGNPEYGGFGSFSWDYHGSPSVPMIWTLSEPYGAPSWWPCKDVPSDKADSVNISITVPDGLTAVSNGKLVSVLSRDAAHITYAWQTRYPISTYLVSLAISNYETFRDWYVNSANDSMPVDYYVLPEHLAKAREDFKVTVEMISFFTSVFGEYPFINEKYGLAVFLWGGAMEHQTITSYGAGLVTGDHYYDMFNAHELAHQWFGDCITMRRWSHIWLNEGFASYAEALWQEHLGGASAYHDYMKTQQRDYFSGSLFVADTSNESKLFSNTVYDKGSWVLHMLRGVLGDSVFFSSLRAYANNPVWKYGNVLTEDFQAVCEQESGEDLEWFFNEWVYREGRPDYSVVWYSYGTSPYTVKVKINQPDNGFYQMPLVLQFNAAGIDTSIKVMNSQNNQEFKFSLSACPDSLTFDPGNWVLKHVTVANLGHFPQELPQQFSVSQNYPNPFNAATKVTIAVSHPGRVDIEIYNVMGQLVFHEQKNYNAGYQIFYWNGKNNQGKLVPSGLYFYRIRNEQAGYTRKMTLIK